MGIEVFDDRPSDPGGQRPQDVSEVAVVDGSMGGAGAGCLVRAG
ncbi:hypothetical protein ACWDUG_20165 [Streptomyces cellulosae]